MRASVLTLFIIGALLQAATAFRAPMQMGVFDG